MPEKGTGESGKGGDVRHQQIVNRQASSKCSSCDEAAEDKHVHNSSSAVVLSRGQYFTIHSDNNQFHDGACIQTRRSLLQK